jgi:preprotein translocase subunit SecE
MMSPFEFMQQVRAEGAKVTWPSRRETLITTAMVFVFAFIASLFFLFADYVIRFGMSTLLSFLR